MLRFVDPDKRIQWDTFTVQDDYAAKFRINVGVATVSEDMLNLMLGFKTWSGVRYLNDDGEYEIGYGIGDPDDVQGYTESQAYSEWIGWVKNRQKILRAQLPIVGITQTAFDALLGLYLGTGTWRTVQSNEGTYDLADAVKNANWLLAADIISRCNIEPEQRRAEARVMQLADYTSFKTRRQQSVQGVLDLRKKYVVGIANDFDKKQAEFVYYRQLGVFLPGMSQLRQRRVINQALT